jgi:hypothetical protein
MYTYSWVGVYHGYYGTIYNNHIVLFGSQTGGKKTTSVENNGRFYVNVWFSDEQSQTYFYPPYLWSKMATSLQPELLIYRVDSLSLVKHGMITNGYPYTKSPCYKPPFCLTFKTNHSVDSDFLTFNHFLIPISYARILSMLTFDDDSDKFIPEFKSDIYLPYLNSPSLNSVLEFQIYDAEKRLVRFMDLSQLYIYIEVLA